MSDDPGLIRRARVVELLILLACCPCASALNPALDIDQYAHTAWTIREGFFKGTIYSIAQTADGYLWLGSEFGLLRFDGNRSVLWQPPEGQHLPGTTVTKLLAARNGTLWIGTDAGLASWNGARLTQRPELDAQLVLALLEDRTGTVWAGALGFPTGRLCAIRSGTAQCEGRDGAFGQGVQSLYEDSTGILWAGAQSGLWRWKPGPPTRYTMPPGQLKDLNTGDAGELLIAMPGGIRRLAHGRSEPSAVPGLRESFNANRLLRDRDGGFWIGTLDRGLVHVHQGRTDALSRSDGLSGNLIFSLFEDREGNVWAATNGGLDRFRELPVFTVSVKQGLSSDNAWSVLAARDGSVWIGSPNGLNRWTNGEVTIFHKSSGLPADAVQSLFQDDAGRIWAFALDGLAYFANGRFVQVNSVPGGEAHFMAEDKAGNLWVSEQQGLLRLRAGRLVERIPWPQIGRQENASVLQPDRDQGGMWLGFWRGGGVAYFRDSQVRAAYTAAQGLSERAVAGLELGRDGSLWAATEGGGLAWIRDGRVATLTTSNGLPCDTVHWTMEEDDGSLWLYTACGLVRIAPAEIAAWIADPRRRIQTTVWDAADGVRLRSTASSGYSPRVAKTADGKLWFVTGNGINVVDPRHLPFNKFPPRVHIEGINADGRTHDASSGMHLPPLVRDVWIDYTAPSFVAPEKVRFRYKLEGQDPDWKEVINDRRVQYSNLSPGNYRFRVTACNNSGVWNETGALLDFSVDPAWYQTNWFRVASGAAFLALFWALYRRHLLRIRREFNMRLEERVNERTRIARDLHDTLLQSFQGLMLRLQVGVDQLPEGNAKEALEKALERADQAIAEGRDSIHDLRSSTVMENDLAQALGALGDELASADSATFRLVVEGSPRNLHPILRDEIYRIAREAVRNAFRHAEAGRIEAEITYGDRLLRMRIRDDGRGMDPEMVEEGREGHYGLPGMRERATRIGAKLNVWSAIGAGTEIDLSLPGAIAYRTAPGRPWWHRLWPVRRKNTD